MSDIEALRRDASLTQIAGSFGVKIKKDGGEYLGCCPFHREDTPSFTVFSGRDGVQRFHCFGCGEKGDVIDFVKAIKGVDTREALRFLKGDAPDRPNIAPREVEAVDHYAGITPIDPPAAVLQPGVKIKLYNPKRKDSDREWGSITPSAVYPYRTIDGKLIGYVLRHDFQDGGKETPMVMAVRLPNGVECWCRFPFPKPRPLYGLQDIAGAKQIIVVEGEKCRDRLVKATKYRAVSWCGGTQGARHADWSALKGHDVLVWPDDDDPGYAVAIEIRKLLGGVARRVRIIDRQGSRT